MSGELNVNALMSPESGEMTPGVTTPYNATVDTIINDMRAALKKKEPADPVAFMQHYLNNCTTTEEALSPVVCQLIPQRYPDELRNKALSIVVLGASGDLAKKKTFPALFSLYCRGLLPLHAKIFGYARSKMTNAELHKRIRDYLPHRKEWMCHIDDFTAKVFYVAGTYTEGADFQNLNRVLTESEDAYFASQSGKAGGFPVSKGGNRVFYLALPPTAFVDACTGISRFADSHSASSSSSAGYTRVVVEKPFGHDTDSSNELSAALSKLLQEEQIYRIDHYLGKEMVQNLTVLRFANHVFGALWTYHHIANVQITFKEKIGTEGRGGYFDKFGIIRDVIQNHLTQILALVAMEKPKSLNAEHVRDEKVAVLKSVRPVTPEDCVLGQYTAAADGSMPGYLEDPTVPEGSKCPTFAAMRMYIDNDRWQGVPFLIKAGKALSEKEVIIRIQFRDEVLPFKDQTKRNELVIRTQPNEAIYLKMTAKMPGIGTEVHQSELDLTYGHRYSGEPLPDAYESLINEVVQGNATNFVRSDELEAAWNIFTPLLHSIDRGEVTPAPYAAGTRGPPEADALAAKVGYKRSIGYLWKGHFKEGKL